MQKIVEIPRDRHIHLDFTVPENVPCGITEVALVFSVSENTDTSAKKGSANLDPAPFAPPRSIEECEREAKEKTAWRQTHPEEFRAMLREVQEAGPLFGGIDGVEFQRKIRDEWPNY
ncbi:hypothetical protein FACS189494_05590 [Spirochaetia bacterium]|nr:hypothetical protein FACS189494_05590 [Spirochaetia bacterium]